MGILFVLKLVARWAHSVSKPIKYQNRSSFLLLLVRRTATLRQLRPDDPYRHCLRRNYRDTI